MNVAFADPVAGGALLYGTQNRTLEPYTSSDPARSCPARQCPHAIRVAAALVVRPPNETTNVATVTSVSHAFAVVRAGSLDSLWGAFRLRRLKTSLAGARRRAVVEPPRWPCGAGVIKQKMFKSAKTKRKKSN